MSTMAPRGVVFSGIAAATVLVDQLLKLVLSRQLAEGQAVSIFPFLRITITQNTGAGFSILQGQTQLLIWFSVMVIGAILYFYDRLKERPMLIAVALILGGTIGNLIDRLAHGHVIDFIDLSFWPSFNIADAAIVAGAALLAIHILKKDKQKQERRNRNKTGRNRKEEREKEKNLKRRF